VARKKSPVHISMYVGLNIVGTTAILQGTHLTIHLDISLKALFLIDIIILLSKKLSIVLCGVQDILWS